jgi:hypothetical protein
MPKPQTAPDRPETSSGYFGDEGRSPLTRGGNSTLTNGNEFHTLDRTIETVPAVYCETYGMEDDSHTQGVYRRDLI